MVIPMKESGLEIGLPSVGAEPQGRLETVAEEPIAILIVDDEPRNLFVLRSILDSPEYRLVSAGSADEALLALINDQFALLILDVRMPGTNGFELAQLIRERKKTAQIPIMFLTAYYGEDQHVLDAYGVGAVDYLQKPVSASVLRSKVAVFAELYRKNRQAQRTSEALLAEIEERRRTDDQLRELNATLERRVAARTTELRESRARLRNAADLARLTYMSLDYARDRIEVSDNFSEIMGVTLPGGDDPGALAEGVRLLSQRVAAKDRTRFLEATENAQGSLPDKLEYRLVGDDGKERWIESEWRTEAGPELRTDRLFVTNLDVTDRRRSEERLRLLMAEVNHRSKNLLSVIQAMVTQTSRNADPKTFARRLSDRLHALSASQDLLIKNDWGGIELSELVRSQLGHFADLIGARIMVDGPAVWLTAGGSQAMGMAIHELATNAAKYGSLSGESGSVDISWSITGDEAPLFCVRWAEKDGPLVSVTERKGFGHLVVGPIVASALGGDVEWKMQESGVLWTLSAPAKAALEAR
jgi:two-component sensor histidine kinase/DNA-binding response OmpR family regulator